MSQPADHPRCTRARDHKGGVETRQCEGSHCAVIYDRLGTLLQVVCVRGLCYAPRTLRGREEWPGVQQQSGP
jgi:hypothetical protein